MATRPDIKFYNIKEPSFQGVSNGSLATVTVPRGFTYYKLDLVCYDSQNNLIPVDDLGTVLGNLTVKADGRAFIDQIPVSFLLSRESYYKEAYNQGGVNREGVVPIRFEMDSLNTLAEKSVFAIGTANLSSLTIDLEIKSDTVSRIDVFSRKSNEIRNFGTHIALRRFDREFAGSGNYDENNLTDSLPDGAYRALFIDEGAGAISDAIVFRDNTRIFEEVPKALNELHQTEAKRTPQSGYYTIDFGINNTISSMVRMPIADWRQRLNWSTSPNQFTIFAEFVEGMEALTATTN